TEVRLSGLVPELWNVRADLGRESRGEAGELVGVRLGVERPPRERTEEGDRVQALRRADHPAGPAARGADIGRGEHAEAPRGQEREGSGEESATMHAPGLSPERASSS